MRFKKTKWGWWAVILDRKHFKVKLLRFKKGSAISHQYHNLRSELWCFLYGTGWFNWYYMIVPETNAARENYRVRAGEFKHVSPKQHHIYRAEKPTLVLEIQYGEKCEESDIVRL